MKITDGNIHPIYMHGQDAMSAWQGIFKRKNGLVPRPFEFGYCVSIGTGIFDGIGRTMVLRRFFIFTSDKMPNEKHRATPYTECQHLMLRHGIFIVSHAWPKILSRVGRESSGQSTRLDKRPQFRGEIFLRCSLTLSSVKFSVIGEWCPIILAPNFTFVF